MQLVDVPLGGKMTINTKNGPMLLDVGTHMQCKQCHSQFLHMLATCPCQVPVGGSKDGVYYSGTVTVKRTDKDEDSRCASLTGQLPHAASTSPVVFPHACFIDPKMYWYKPEDWSGTEPGLTKVGPNRLRQLAGPVPALLLLREN